MPFSTEPILRRICACAAFVTGSVVVSIFIFLFAFGLPLFRDTGYLQLFLLPWRPVSALYGIGPMVVGTSAISLLALVIALPVSLGAAAAAETDMLPARFRSVIRPVFRLMTAIPTVVYGFIGVFTLVPFLRSVAGGSGFCVLSAALFLALMISPTMILFFSDAFSAVPVRYIRATQAMGCRPEETLVFLMLPVARNGILAGILLAAGRAVGDTLIALMLAGNSVALPDSVFSSARSLTAHIALVMAADTKSPEFQSIFACGLTLYLFTSLLTLGCRRLLRKGGPP